MTKLAMRVLAGTLLVFAFASASQAAWDDIVKDDPIWSYGHGGAFDSTGDLISFDETSIEAAQDYYWAAVDAELQESGPADYESIRVQLESLLVGDGLDDAAVRSWVLAWMITVAYPNDSTAAAFLHLRNEALRKASADLTGGGGVPGTNTAAFLTGQGVETERGTNNGGAAYITECSEADVPIPPDWGTASWTNQGVLTPNFLGGTATVYTYESVTPRGGCIALPRQYGVPGVIGLLGIICLGQDSSKACFWDNKDVPVGVVVPITDFVGGADLNPPNWSGGICSDCHAGENPWNVHPGSSLASWGHKMPVDWHEPLVHPSWPQNPGPTLLLDSISGDPDGRACLTCHSSGFAGRFPRVSTEIRGYCVSVLSVAARTTMPNAGNPALDIPLPSVGDPGSGYMAHAQALEAACAASPTDGVVVPGGGLDEDASIVSRPIVVGPLYACAELIKVRGTIRHGEIRVYIDDLLVANQTSLDPDEEIIAVPTLVAGQVVEASQVVDGVESARSEKVVVRDHQLDYPSGLPAPRIDPTLIHECGRTIAVRHITGARVTVLTNAADPVSYNTGGDWTNLPPAIRPFILGDKYTAYQNLCDDTSPDSTSETAVVEPSPMPTPVVSSPIYAGQELVDVSNLAHGGLTKVEVVGAGVVKEFTTAVSWQPNVDVETGLGSPLMAGDAVRVQQELCTTGPYSVVTNETVDCDTLLPPEIRNPFAGQEQIEVLAAVPGARIRVYDSTGAEIADGSGDIITTTRPLVEGELIRATQQIGQCTSSSAYQVEVYASLAALPEPGGLVPLAAAIGLLSRMAARRRRRRA